VTAARVEATEPNAFGMLHVYRGAVLLGDLLDPDVGAFGVSGRWVQRCSADDWAALATDAVDGRIGVAIGTGAPAMRAKMAIVHGDVTDVAVDIDLG